MGKKRNKFRKADGSMKPLIIDSNIAMDRTIDELEDYMDFLGVPREDWAMSTMPETPGKVGLAFKFKGVNYLMTSEKQSRAKSKPSIAKNARVILHMIQERVRTIRKGAETVESAIGGYVHLLSTPKLPSWMDEQLQARGVTINLPHARNGFNQLEDNR